MDLGILQNLLDKIQGCTFASLDAICYPKPGIRQEIKGERVILFTNKKCSGYENMVRKGLTEAGKDPDSFVLGKLPWGERVPESPLIIHKGNFYLQTIVLVEGQSIYFVNNVPTPIEAIGLPARYMHPDPDRVTVHTYKLESIKRIALMGHILVADDERAIMPLSIA